jgi:hypothetical protein
MNGAIPPLPNTPSWRGAQLKHRDIFTFTFTFYYTVKDNTIVSHGERKGLKIMTDPSQ